MGCKTGEFATMDTIPQPSAPSSAPAPTVGAIDYGNHVIEALLKMSSDTDDDDEDSLNPLLPSFPEVGARLYPGRFQQIPGLGASTGFASACTSQDSPSTEQRLVSLEKQMTPLGKSYMSPHWQKVGTAYSKDDSVLQQQNSSFEYGSEKKAYSNDECITPITPRLQKKPTYLNLSCMGKYEMHLSPTLPNQVENQSASSLSSLTDSYPAFTGDTSDCPYGQNYNKPRGLTKFEYHSSYIKQCQIERTARTKKVWEKSSKQRQILSRKRKLMRQRKVDGNNELTSPNLSNPDLNKGRLSSVSKPHRKKRLIHSRVHSHKDHSSTQEQPLENTDILNKAIGYLAQEESNLEELSGNLATKPKRNCLDFRLSANQSDTSYPASSRTWSTHESVNTELVSSNYSIFKSHVDQSHFTSSPIINASNSSMERVPELLLSNSSLNLSSARDSSSLVESLLEASSNKCNRGFAFRDDDLFSSVSSSSQKDKLYTDNIPSACTRMDPTLSDSSVSLSTSLGERPDCVGQSCSNTDSESEDLQQNSSSSNSDTSQIEHSAAHIANILSSTRNSQGMITPDRKKGPVIISPLSSEKSFSINNEEQQLEDESLYDDSFLPNDGFVCPLPPKTLVKKISPVTDDKICTQIFPFVQNDNGQPSTASCSLSSSLKKKLLPAAPKQTSHDHPSSTNKPVSSPKAKRDLQANPESMSKNTYVSLPKCGSVYFTPISLSSPTTIKPTSFPFTSVCSNVSSEDKRYKSPSRHKAHRQAHVKVSDKNFSAENAPHRLRTHAMEHRKSSFNNKENKATGKYERPNERMGLAAAKAPCDPAILTPYLVSKDSGLGACRSSDPGQFWATPYIDNLSDPPDQLAAHGGHGSGSRSKPNKHHTQKDGFHLRDKKAVIKNFWNFHKKFIRKDRKAKGDTEFKTLAHV